MKLSNKDEKQQFAFCKDDIFDIINIHNFIMTRPITKEQEKTYEESKEQSFKEKYDMDINEMLDTQVLAFNDFKLNYLPVDAFSFFKKVESLYLKNIGFESLAVLNNLGSLTLRNNDIKEFPDFSNFPESLKLVDLSHNDIKEIKIDPFKTEKNGKYRKSSIENLYLDFNINLSRKQDDEKVFTNIIIY